MAAPSDDKATLKSLFELMSEGNNVRPTTTNAALNGKHQLYILFFGACAVGVPTVFRWISSLCPIMQFESPKGDERAISAVIPLLQDRSYGGFVVMQALQAVKEIYLFSPTS